MDKTKVFTIIRQLYISCGLSNFYVRHEHTNRFGVTLIEITHSYRYSYLQIVFRENVVSFILSCHLAPWFLGRYNGPTEIKSLDQLQAWC